MNEPSRQGCLLLAGDYFLFAASRPTPLTPGAAHSFQLAVGAVRLIRDTSPS
jgi:hypothetical protein